MCGIFFVFDAGSSGSELDSKFSSIASDHLKFRGPDGVSTLSGECWFALHALLSVTGSTSQPCSWRDGIFLFNGEIYNDWQNYDATYGDADLLACMLDADGINALATLDGEFACVVLDETRKRLHLLSDPFGTKPFYYALQQGRVAAGTFDYLLRDCGFDNPLRCPANQRLEIDLETGTLVGMFQLIDFDFNASTINSYDPFCEAFSIALRKRTEKAQQKIYLPLSSGHDSGLIAAELENQGVDFTAYGFEFGEVADILNERYDRLREWGITASLLSPDKKSLDQVGCQLLDQIPPFQLQVDDNTSTYIDSDARKVPGYIAAAYIAKLASLKGEIICLSGQGADEIISDYYNQHTNSRRSYFRGHWERATSPWPNFFGGWNKLFLEASERITGHFGIETRYPFLDPLVVQQFLNLRPELKGRRYKACISYRLDQLEYPYHDRKIGFGGFDIHGS